MARIQKIERRELEETSIQIDLASRSKGSDTTLVYTANWLVSAIDPSTTELHKNLAGMHDAVLHHPDRPVTSTRGVFFMYDKLRKERQTTMGEVSNFVVASLRPSIYTRAGVLELLRSKPTL